MIEMEMGCEAFPETFPASELGGISSMRINQRQPFASQLRRQDWPALVRTSGGTPRSKSFLRIRDRLDLFTSPPRIQESHARSADRHVRVLRKTGGITARTRLSALRLESAASDPEPGAVRLTDEWI